MFFYSKADDGIRDYKVTGVQTCALPISVTLAMRAVELEPMNPGYPNTLGVARYRPATGKPRPPPSNGPWNCVRAATATTGSRSEERRVGKEGRHVWRSGRER